MRSGQWLGLVRSAVCSVRCFDTDALMIGDKKGVWHVKTQFHLSLQSFYSGAGREPHGTGRPRFTCKNDC